MAQEEAGGNLRCGGREALVVEGCLVYCLIKYDDVDRNGWGIYALHSTNRDAYWPRCFSSV